MSFDRFDLEEQIMNTWAVVDDLRDLDWAIHNDKVNMSDVAAIVAGVSSVYNIKFEKLFDIFSEMISDGQISGPYRKARKASTEDDSDTKNMKAMFEILARSTIDEGMEKANQYYFKGDDYGDKK